MRFIGVDLAWSDNNPTGMAVLEEEEDSLDLLQVSLVGSDDEIFEWIKEWRGDSAFVAIDAPLVVPNEEGRRPAEDVTSALFREYDAGPYPANRSWLERVSGRVRGEDIATGLEEMGFDHDLGVSKKECRDVFFEVYPHPSMVVLFDLDKTLKYKGGSRSYEERYDAFDTYVEKMKGLSIGGLDFLEENYRELRGSGLKEFEDKMDSIFCAYIAYYRWAFPDECRVLGNKEEGYILTPVFDDDLEDY